MNKKIIFTFIMFSQFAQADYAQNQVRYLGYYDIVNNFKNSNIGKVDCIRPHRGNGEAFGFDLPIKGEPISDKPNFNFLNSYLLCARNMGTYDLILKILPDGHNFDEISTMNYTQIPKEQLTILIKELIISLIGPEEVVKSYGYFNSLDALTTIIQSASEEAMSKHDEEQLGSPYVTIYLGHAIKFIQLRDEYLTY